MGQKKSIGCLFFSIFNKKITALMPIFYPKKVNSLKNTLLSCPYKRPFSQKHGALMSFFQIFHEKAPVVMPILGQKNVISVKTALYYGQKKSIGCSFCSAFSQKNHCSHAHILSKIRLFSKNTLLSYPY